MIGNTKLWSDSVGVWRKDPDKDSSGIEWGEIDRICGYQLGVRGNSSTHIELIFPFGSALEIDSTWDGYSDVIHNLLERFSIDAAELERLDARDPDDEYQYVELWSVQSSQA